MNDKEVEERQEKLRLFRTRCKIKNKKLESILSEARALLIAKSWQEYFEKWREYFKEYKYYNFYRNDLPTTAVIAFKEFVEDTFFGIKLRFDVDKPKMFETPYVLELEKSINIDDESYSFKIELEQHASILDICLYYKDLYSDTWYEFAGIRHVMVINTWEDWNQWEKAKMLILNEMLSQLYKGYLRKIKKFIPFPLAIVGGLFLFIEACKYIGLVI